MSDNMVSESAERLFATVSAAQAEDEWSSDLWSAIEEAGYPYALIEEEDGGFGLDPQDVLQIIKIAGRRAVALPLAETMVVNWLLAKAVLPLVETGAGTFISENEATAPWGRNLSVLLKVIDKNGSLILERYEADSLEWHKAVNIAGEPRDRIQSKVCTCQSAELELDPTLPHTLMALMRTHQIAGALDTILEMSVRYVMERVQFGRPLGKFQAIQQYLAVMASEVSAAGAAASMAAASFTSAVHEPFKFRLLVGAGKLRANEAAGTVAELAHQVHGAIGFSQEYDLHRYSRRVWSWRDEAGSEAEWARLLGQSLRGGAPGHLWAEITALQKGI